MQKVFGIMPGKINRFSELIAISLVLSFFFFAVLGYEPRGGPDFYQYLAWTNAALSGDIVPTVPGNMISPLGFPITQWGHGTGFIFAVGALLFGNGLSPIKGAYIVGWLSSILLWWSMFYLIRLASKDNRRWFIFGDRDGGIYRYPPRFLFKSLFF